MIPDFCSDYLLWASTVLVKLPFFLLAPPWEKQDMFGPEIFFNLSSLDPQFTFQVSCGVPSRGIGCSRFGTWGWWSKTWWLWFQSNFKGNPRLRPCQNHTSHGQKWTFRGNIIFDPWTHELKHFDRQSNRHPVTWGCEQRSWDLFGRNKRNLDKHGCTETIPPPTDHSETSRGYT